MNRRTLLLAQLQANHNERVNIARYILRRTEARLGVAPPANRDRRA